MDTRLKQKYGAELNKFLKEFDLYDGNYKALTEPEAYALLRSESLDIARDKIIASRPERRHSLLQESLQEPKQETELNPSNNDNDQSVIQTNSPQILYTKQHQPDDV